VRRNKQLTKQI